MGMFEDIINEFRTEGFIENRTLIPCQHCQELDGKLRKTDIKDMYVRLCDDCSKLPLDRNFFSFGLFGFEEIIQLW